MDKAPVNQVNLRQGVYFAVFGRRFQTREAAEQFRSDTIARREKLAGRELTERELFKGFANRVEDRTLEHKVRDEDWRMIPVPSDDDPRHPMDDPDFLRGPQKETLKELRARARADYDARMKREAMPSLDKVSPAEQFALDVWERVAFSSSPMSHMALAEKIRDQVDGDPVVFKRLTEQFAAISEAHYTDQRTAVEIAQLQAEQRLASIPRPLPSFNADQQQAPGLGYGESYSRYHDGSVSHLRKDGDKTIVLKTWQAGEVPADVAESVEGNQ